jgi:hypothetical protein
MSRGQQTFKQNDITRAIKATVKAGIAVERVEIDQNGKIVIITAISKDAVGAEKAEENEWDTVLQ